MHVFYAQSYFFYLAPLECAFVQHSREGAARLEIISFFKGTREEETIKKRFSGNIECSYFIRFSSGHFETNDGDKFANYDSLCFTCPRNL